MTLGAEGAVVEGETRVVFPVGTVVPLPAQATRSLHSTQPVFKVERMGMAAGALAVQTVCNLLYPPGAPRVADVLKETVMREVEIEAAQKEKEREETRSIAILGSRKRSRENTNIETQQSDEEPRVQKARVSHETTPGVMEMGTEGSNTVELRTMKRKYEETERQLRNKEAQEEQLKAQLVEARKSMEHERVRRKSMQAELKEERKSIRAERVERQAIQEELKEESTVSKKLKKELAQLLAKEKSIQVLRTMVRLGHMIYSILDFQTRYN